MARQKTQKSLFLEVEEVATLLGISRGSAYAACRNGTLPVVRIGRLIKVPRAAVERMAMRQPDTAA